MEKLGVPKPKKPAASPTSPLLSAHSASLQSPDVPTFSRMPTNVAEGSQRKSDSLHPLPMQQNLRPYADSEHCSYPPDVGVSSRLTPRMSLLSGSNQRGPSSMTSTTGIIFNEADGLAHSMSTSSSSLSSGQSPRLQDLLLPGTDMNAPSPEYVNFRSQYPDSLYRSVPFGTPHDPMEEDKEEDDVEEVVRQRPPGDPDPEPEDWVMCLPSPAPSAVSAASESAEGAIVHRAAGSKNLSELLLLQEVQFDPAGPEMLTLHFDRQTCGILSVKDGPTENPWRTLIWPLARDSPALYHAIASMTSFHVARGRNRTRIEGLEHMRRSIQELSSGLENMRLDTAIATTISLAFAEAWDQHTTTGINHIKGARVLVNQALVKHRASALSERELVRLRFLCKSWIYMDVISRLSSFDDDESNDFDVVSEMLSAGPLGTSSFIEEETLDPLMGCATTLFPIVGRVANLVRRVCRAEGGNTPSIIAAGVALKQELEAWRPPQAMCEPEDPTIDVVHSRQTAEAYRYASLLYLHQAVPEVPSLSSAQLARRTMNLLATVPLSSRAVIVQIYPLTAAGCEATGAEREWVLDRWTSLGRRMLIGVIDKAREVVEEVWRRRDAWIAEGNSMGPSLSSPPAPPTPMKRNFSLHGMGAEGNFDNGDRDSSSLHFSESAKRRAVSAGGSGGPKGWMETPRPVRLSGGMPGDVQARKGSGGSTAEVQSVEHLPEEFTVRGSLHWLGVMKDWNWEGELQLCLVLSDHADRTFAVLLG